MENTPRAGSVAGRFITIEGGEGVGKSLLIQHIAQKLRSCGKTVRVTREPGGTPAADAIRQLFLSPPSGEKLHIRTEALLVNAARAQHVFSFIRPAIEAGEWVLCDRFSDSTRVYQNLAGQLSASDIEMVIHFATGGLEPDLTLLLDCPVDISLQRLAARTDERTRFDAQQKNFHEAVRQAYLALAQRFSKRCHTIDAQQSAATVADLSWQAVAGALL